jgi:hypothetical protein
MKEEPTNYIIELNNLLEKIAFTELTEKDIIDFKTNITENMLPIFDALPENEQARLVKLSRLSNDDIQNAKKHLLANNYSLGMHNIKEDLMNLFWMTNDKRYDFVATKE